MSLDLHQRRTRWLRGAIRRVCRAAAVAGLAGLLMSGQLSAQYTVVSPAGDTITVETAVVREMLDSTRALRRDLEEDPRVMYGIGYGDRATEENPAGDGASSARSASRVRSTTNTFAPARASRMPAAAPAGPAPTISTSGRSSIR